MADLALHAQTAVSHGSDLGCCRLLPGQNTGQHEIVDRPGAEKDASRQSHDGHITQPGVEEQGTGQHRAAVGDDLCSRGAHPMPGHIIRVHGKAAAGQNNLTARILQRDNRPGDLIGIIGYHDLVDKLTAVVFEFGDNEPV